MVAGEGVVFADLFAADGVLTYPFAPPGHPRELRGRDAIRAYFAAAGQARALFTMAGADALTWPTDDPPPGVPPITHHSISPPPTGPWQAAIWLPIVKGSQMAAFQWITRRAVLMDEVFRALADPSRRRLLDSLNGRSGQTLRELCAGLDMARQSVSKHLAVLEEAGLVTTVRRGREKLHYLNAAPISAIAERWISRYDQPTVSALADL